MHDVMKLGLKLLLITAVAALALGLTYTLTKEPIAMQQEKAAAEARMAVLPSAQEFEPVEVDVEEYPDIKEVYAGSSDGSIVGYTIKATSKGYGGQLEVMIGINADNTIQTVKLLSHSETPGLGAKAAEPKFQEQFNLKSAAGPLEYDEIEAVTGATISSKAVLNAVNKAIGYVNDVLQAGGAAQ